MLWHSLQLATLTEFIHTHKDVCKKDVYDKAFNLFQLTIPKITNNSRYYRGGLARNNKYNRNRIHIFISFPQIIVQVYSIIKNVLTFNFFQKKTNAE